MLGGDRRIIIILVQLLFFLGVPSVVDGAIVFEESQSGTALSTDTVTSATITGVNDHLYLAAIGARSAHTVSSVSGLGLTWTEVAAQCAARETTSGISIWKAQGTVSGDDTVTATLDSNSNTLVLVVARYSGVNTDERGGQLRFGQYLRRRRGLLRRNRQHRVFLRHHGYFSGQLYGFRGGQSKTHLAQPWFRLHRARRSRGRVWEATPSEWL